MKILILIVIAFVLLLTFACMNVAGTDYDCGYNCKDCDSKWWCEDRRK